MKRGIFTLAITAGILLAGITPALAYDPPSENATDVILWYGDNLTATVNITGLEETVAGLEDAIANLDDAMVEAVEAQTASQVSTAVDFLALLVVALIVALTFWQRTIILYCLAVPVCMVYGLALASSSTQGSSLWVAGIAIAIIGTYLLFRVVMIGLGEIKERLKKENAISN